MAPYDNETYLQSLATARGAIDRQVGNTLAEIGRQEQVAVGQTQQIPGAVARTNEQAGEMALGAQRQMRGAVDGNRGLEHRLGGTFDRIHGNVQNRLQAVQDAWGRASGLLAQGFGEQADQRRGSVDMIGQQLYADNDLQRMGYIAGRQAEDRSRAFAEEQAARQNSFAQEQLGQQAALQREALAAQAAEAQRQRDWQAEQARGGLLHQALLVNPFTGQIEAAPAPVSQEQNLLRNLASALGRIR